MKFDLKRVLPEIGIILAFAVQVLIKDSPLHPPATHHYYTGFLIILFAIYGILIAVSFFNEKLAKKLSYSGPFYFGFINFFTVLSLISGKFALLPVLFFPLYDSVLGIFVETWPFLLKCVAYSFRLLGLGVFWGILVGFTTGVFLGFSKRVMYWLNPIIKIIGPIPATAWIPLALTTFPTPFGASIFIVSLSVWFPVVLMTSSGIWNINSMYFEVAETLGAKPYFQILKIGIPGALPNIFQGLFNGICSAFIALMTAEMFGAKYGIGWYISWQKSMMIYSGVYAGLIMIALFCTLIITLLFKARGKLLSWQKGLIRW